MTPESSPGAGNGSNGMSRTAAGQPARLRGAVLPHGVPLGSQTGAEVSRASWGWNEGWPVVFVMWFH